MLEEFAGQLEGCDSFGAVRDVFRAAIAPHGFTASAAGAFIPTDTGPESHFFFQDWPEDWIRLYQERNFVAVDFGVAEARRRIAPFTWREARETRVLSQAEQDLWREANAWGWDDGLSVPVHGPGGYFGLVTMAGRNLDLRPAQRRQLQITALMAHDRCLALHPLGAMAAPQSRLSSREMECLRWVASGKTDWEIAAITGLSPTTVKTYVDQARHKLGTRTRSQAVARLVLSGNL